MVYEMTFPCIEVRDCGTPYNVAIYGELSATTSRAHGAVGALIDGGTRDTPRLISEGFPVFARFRTPVEAFGRYTILKCQVPIRISGELRDTLVVNPGDFIFGDVDGVMVIPKGMTLHVLTECERIMELEDLARAEFARGDDPVEVLKRYKRFWQFTSEIRGAELDRFGLVGKVAMVTGATRGIGHAAALCLAEAGADVVVLGHTCNPEATRQAILAMGRRALAFQGDLGEGSFRSHVMNEVLAQWGHVDILVNCAGMQIRTPAVDFAEVDWDRVIDLNLTTLVCLCQQVGREMLKRHSGKIINIASVQSFTGGITIPAYAASKGGVAQVT
jgi:hypothetical protein